MRMREELAILDVAHGSTALVTSSGETAILDAAPKTVLLDALEFYGINTIDYVFISHSDFDHMGGVINLLANKNLRIKNLCVNADASKNTAAWSALAVAVNDAFSRYKLSVNGLNASMPAFTVGQAEVNVLYPLPGNALMGASAKNLTGKKISSNATSAVLMIRHSGHNLALFAGDMEQDSLDAMIESKFDMQADVLVFPHHGGHVGGDMQRFAISLTQQVQPKFTVFSIGRNTHSNPQPIIVSAVKSVVPNTHIMCTQLSKNCYTDTPPLSLDWIMQIGDVPGIGVESNSSCSGSIRIEMDGSNSIFHLTNEHKEFVANNIPNRLCK